MVSSLPQELLADVLRALPEKELESLLATSREVFNAAVHVHQARKVMHLQILSAIH